MIRRFRAWAARLRALEPLAHDTDWHDALDETRDELTNRRTRRDLEHQERGTELGNP